MEEFLHLVSASAVPAAALALLLVQWVKRFIPEEKRDLLLPPVSIALGIVLCAAITLTGVGEWRSVPISGIVAGMSASGFFSYIRTRS